MMNLTVSCIPSAFDAAREEDEATACDAGAPDCDVMPDAGGGDAGRGSTPADGGGSAVPPAASPSPDAAAEPSVPSRDASSPPQVPPHDAGAQPPTDAGAPSDAREDWPQPDPTDENKIPHLGDVYVQWCEKTSYSVGAVCRLFTGAQIGEASKEECRRDLTICGRPAEPIFFCNRASTTCIPIDP